MKEKVFKGRIVAYVPRHEINGTIRWTIVKTAKNIYRCDANGRILSYDGKSKKPTELNEVKDTVQHKHPRVRIGKKLVRKDFLIAFAVFGQKYPFTKNEVGHFDGDPKNCKVENIYIDITPKEPTDEVQAL